MIAASTYIKHGSPNNSEEMVRQAKAIAKEISRVDSERVGASAHTVLGWYYGMVDEPESIYRHWKEVTAKQTGYPGTPAHTAVGPYRMGRFSEALETLERLRPRTEKQHAWVDTVKTYFMAEVGQKAEAIAAARQAANDHPDALEPLGALLLLGEREEAARRTRDQRGTILESIEIRNPYRREWFANIVDFIEGAIDSDELLAAAGDSWRRHGEARHLIALMSLANRERDKAKHHFLQAKEKPVYTCFRSIRAWSWHWSCAFLERMEADSSWPPWIDED